MFTNHEGETLHLGEFPGVVVANVDPLKLSRVRVRVEGLIEPESPWAFPKGSTGGGKANRGAYDVPAIGATVVVSFLGGNIDVPIYDGAWRGQSEGMTALSSVSAEDAVKVKIYETDRYSIVANEIPGSEELTLTDKVSGAVISIKGGLVQLGALGLGEVPLQNGVVLASGIDSFTGLTYGALGSASNVVTAKK
jgi:hypothetical protein